MRIPFAFWAVQNCKDARENTWMAWLNGSHKWTPYSCKRIYSHSLVRNSMSAEAVKRHRCQEIYMMTSTETEDWHGIAKCICVMHISPHFPLYIAYRVCMHWRTRIVMVSVHLKHCCWEHWHGTVVDGPLSWPLACLGLKHHHLRGRPLEQINSWIMHLMKCRCPCVEAEKWLVVII